MRPLLFLLLAACSDGAPDDTEAIACGDTLRCTGDAICLQESFEPTCEDAPGEDPTCPEGTTLAMCGGDGHACCCGPRPEPRWACAVPTACDGAATCDCVECPQGKECSTVGSETSGVFSCDEPAVP